MPTPRRGSQRCCAVRRPGAQLLAHARWGRYPSSDNLNSNVDVRLSANQKRGISRTRLFDLFDRRLVMCERTAIVIGGGIGGLATAAGLSRAGWRVTVLEQAPRFAAVGAGIALAPNAVRALDWLGVGAALRGRSVATGAAGLRSTSGRW